MLRSPKAARIVNELVLAMAAWMPVMRRLFIFLLMVCGSVATPSSASDPCYKVKDLNTSLQGSTSIQYNRAPCVTAAGIGYFVANDGIHGPQLWRTDGTTNGTSMIKDVVPGGWNIAELVASGSKVYFTVENGNPGSDLLVSDGTAAGTFRLGSGSNLTDVNGTLFFARDKGLYKTDGTVKGTILVKAFNQFTPTGAAINYGGILLFAGGDSGPALWRSDGTANGTYLLQSFGTFDFAWKFTRVGNKVYFTLAYSNEIWVTDGTASGTQQVVDLSPSLSLAGYASLLFDVNGTLYVACHDINSQIFSSDGTAAGTVPIAMNGNQISDYASKYAVLGNKLYLIGTDGAGGSWLCAADASGIARIRGDNGYLCYGPLLTVNNLLYFNSNVVADQDNAELFAFDGTNTPALVKDISIRPATQYSTDQPFIAPANFAAFGTLLFFSHDDGITGREPYLTDGTAANTQLLKDINTQTDGAYMQQLYGGGSLLYFHASNILYRSDGTDSGTFKVTGTSDFTSGQVVTIGTTAYFTGRYTYSNNTFSTGYLFSSDGNSISEVLDIGNRDADNMVVIGNHIFFSTGAYTSTHDLWGSDGTAGGTVLLATLPNAINALTDVAGTLYFHSNSTIWKSDGTIAGTVSVQNLYPMHLDQNSALTAFNGDCYFVTSDPGPNGVTTPALCKCDGTTVVKVFEPPGVESVGPYTAVLNGAIYFKAKVTDASGSRRGLWKTDGNTSTFVAEVEISSPLHVVGNQLIFQQTDTLNNNSLFRSDGTPSGTTAYFKMDGYGLNGALSTSGVLYFKYIHSGFGENELWRTDGTAQNTVMVQDIQIDGDGLTNTYNFAVVAGKLFFAAAQSDGDDELWATEIANSTISPSLSGSPEITVEGVVGLQFSYQPSVSVPANTFRLQLASTTPLQAGLSFDSATGAISGTPTEPGDGYFFLSAINDGCQSYVRLHLTIFAAEPGFRDANPTLTVRAGDTLQYTSLTTGQTPINLTLEALEYYYGPVTSMPQGFSENGAVLTASPTQCGNYFFRLTATNSAGSATNMIRVDVPPKLTSPVAVSAVVGEPFTYSASALGSNYLSYFFDPESNDFSGFAIDHGNYSGTFSEAGQFAFHVTARAFAPFGWLQDTQEVVVTVSLPAPVDSGGTDPNSNPPGGSGGNSNGANPDDSDGDGFSDAIESAFGTSPTDPHSTPFKNQPAPPIQALNVTSLKTFLNFKSPARSKVQVSGILPPKLEIPDYPIGVYVSGVAKTFALSAKGSLHSKSLSFKYSTKTGKFSLQLTDEGILPKFAAVGLVNETVANKSVGVAVLVIFGELAASADVPQKYSAKVDRSGKSFMPR